MHIVDYGIGVMLQEVADLKETQDYPKRIVKKLRVVAHDHFRGAERAFPLHQETLERLKKVELHQTTRSVPYQSLSNSLG